MLMPLIYPCELLGPMHAVCSMRLTPSVSPGVSACGCASVSSHHLRNLVGAH